MRSTVSKRGVRGAKRFNPNEWRSMLAKSEMVTSLGVVRKFPGEESHFEISNENGDAEILVDVELIPSGERTLCRIGFGSDGVYKIPRENQEVAVLIPYNPQSLIKDALDYGAIIVGVLDNNAPSQLNDDDIVVVKSTRIHLVSDNIKLGTNPNANDGVVVGTGIDSFTGSTYFALGNASSKVKAHK